LADYHLQIDSGNTFPHSSGIASSASALDCG
jgi:mevalonate pyrophosphate decarboxylase